MLALRVLAARRPDERVAAWVVANAGRRATHAAIARDCALGRETVTRALGRLMRAGLVVALGDRDPRSVGPFNRYARGYALR